MKAELEQQFADEFPSFFVDLGGDPAKTCMAWGCAVGDGWFGLLYNLCRQIRDEIEEDESAKNFKFEQIKEKFGLFRIYCSGGNANIYKMVSLVEAVSSYVCENCGTTLNGVTTEGSWLSTLCQSCRKKSNGNAETVGVVEDRSQVLPVG